MNVCCYQILGYRPISIPDRPMPNGSRKLPTKIPIWIHTKDAKRLGVDNGDLLKMTEIGWFVDKVWVTEAIKPGVVACSHHIGRWRRQQDEGNRFMTNTVRY